MSIFLLIHLTHCSGAHAAWPTVLNPQAAYQLQQQQNAIFQAVGDKNLKDLAIFTGQHHDAQVNKFSLRFVYTGI